MPEWRVRCGGGRRRVDPVVAAGARLVGAAIRASGRGQGATLPGLLAERCAPGIAARRAARLDRVVLVTGTNGKTTTSLLAAALAASGRRVASNAAGSNLYRGMATALLAAGRAIQDAVLEVDEAVLARAVTELRPCLVVLLNLTRDQLDRHHEVGGLARRWRQAVAALAPGAIVVANGGEPPTAWVAQAAPSALAMLLGNRRARLTASLASRYPPLPVACSAGDSAACCWLVTADRDAWTLGEVPGDRGSFGSGSSPTRVAPSQWTDNVAPA